MFAQGVAEDVEAVAAIAFQAVAHFDARHAVPVVPRFGEGVEHHVNVADGIDVPVDVEVAVDGRVLEHRFGRHAASARGTCHRHLFGQHHVGETAVGERFEIDGLARGVVDERPSGRAVAVDAAICTADGVEAVGELPEDALHPRGNRIVVARARQGAHFEDEACQHPSLAVLLHVGVPEPMGFSVERGGAQDLVAQVAPRESSGVVFLKGFDPKGESEFFLYHKKEGIKEVKHIFSQRSAVVCSKSRTFAHDLTAQNLTLQPSPNHGKI